MREIEVTSAVSEHRTRHGWLIPQGLGFQASLEESARSALWPFWFLTDLNSQPRFPRGIIRSRIRRNRTVYVADYVTAFAFESTHTTFNFVSAFLFNLFPA